MLLLIPLENVIKTTTTVQFLLLFAFTMLITLSIVYIYKIFWYDVARSLHRQFYSHHWTILFNKINEAEKSETDFISDLVTLIELRKDSKILCDCALYYFNEPYLSAIFNEFKNRNLEFKQERFSRESIYPLFRLSIITYISVVIFLICLTFYKYPIIVSSKYLTISLSILGIVPIILAIVREVFTLKNIFKK